MGPGVAAAVGAPPERRRICLVVGQLDVGGLERQVYLLATGLDRKRYDVSVVSLARGGRWAEALRKAGVGVVEIGRHGHLDWRRMIGLFRVLRDLRPDVVYSFNNVGNAYARAAGLLAGVPVLIAGERGVYLSWWMALLERLFIRFTECVICNADAIRKDLIGRVGLPGNKVITIRNAVVVPPLPGQEERREARRLMGFAEDEIVVGTIARLDPVKNLSMLADAAALSGAGARLRFGIIGGGPDEDAVRDAIRKHGLEGRFALLGERDEAWTLLPGFDIFVLSSWSEGLPNTLMEAMAAGLPCVCTEVGGCPELVAEGVTGYLVAPGDGAAMSARILELAGDAGLRVTMGRAGRRRIAAGFSVERMVAEVEGIIVKLLDAVASRPRGRRLRADLLGAR